MVLGSFHLMAFKVGETVFPSLGRLLFHITTSSPFKHPVSRLTELNVKFLFFGNKLIDMGLGLHELLVL